MLRHWETRYAAGHVALSHRVIKNSWCDGVSITVDRVVLRWYEIRVHQKRLRSQQPKIDYRLCNQLQRIKLSLNSQESPYTWRNIPNSAFVEFQMIVLILCREIEFALPNFKLRDRRNSSLQLPTPAVLAPLNDNTTLPTPPNSPSTLIFL